MTYDYDAVIVGAGPNGLAAAITLAKVGRRVLVREAQPTIGGGVRSAELTLPGFIHDVGSAIHPLGVGSPFFQTLPLAAHGLEWVYPPAAVAHPLDDGTAVIAKRGVDETAHDLGRDAPAYSKLMGPLTADWDIIASSFLGPLKPLRAARHPLALSRFGLRAIRSARGLARGLFAEERARALFAGMAGHSFLPLDEPPSAAFGLVLGVSAHALGWPLPRGGAQKIADALAAHLRTLGGEIEVDAPVTSLDDLPSARAVLCDVTPRGLLALAGNRLPPGYRRRLERYRYGPAAFKVDFALDGPIPWKDPACLTAGTIHLGGTLDEIAFGESEVTQGRCPERPYILLAQHTLFDPSRAPAGKHTVWAYCHVPNGSTVDMSGRIEVQIERFAPGFHDRILARHVSTPASLERTNMNIVGGDINGGRQDITQLFTRPTLRIPPYSTPAKDIFICSSSTPPGGGVHGMCGYNAARAALRQSSPAHDKVD